MSTFELEQVKNILTGLKEKEQKRSVLKGIAICVGIVAALCAVALILKKLFGPEEDEELEEDDFVYLDEDEEEEAEEEAPVEEAVEEAAEEVEEAVEEAAEAVEDVAEEAVEEAAEACEEAKEAVEEAIEEIIPEE